MSEYRFPKELRICLRDDFQRVHESSTYAADDVLVIRGATNTLEVTRLGLAISRQVGCAVVRNQWKRRIRESFRLLYAKLPKGIDIVVRPRKGASPDFHRIQESLPRLLTRIARGIRPREKQ